MKQKLLASLFLLLLYNTTYAQKVVPQKLKLTWNILSNSKEQTLSELILENPSNTTFAAKGWTIYFNAGNPSNAAEKDTSYLKITHINGDLFSLTPGKNFSGIAAKETARIEINSRNLKNVTDYAQGFYIVYQQQPSKPISLTVKNTSVIDYTIQEKAIALQKFTQNKLAEKIQSPHLIPILPTPVSFEKTAGNFQINANTQISAAPKFQKEAQYLASELHKNLISTPKINASATQNVILLKEKIISAPEGYELEITPSEITIYATERAGIFYGIQSLKSLVPAKAWKVKQKHIIVPALEIKDAPRFGHRAFMMDIARNFQPKAQILKVLDVLSFYKINVLHLHFNDDEAWRIAIDGLPELIEVGSRRGHTLTENEHLFPSYGSGPSVKNQSGSGHLSEADFIEILKYATERHIKVIPEYETPGHARAAIKAMDARYKRLMKAGKPQAAKHYLLRDLQDQSIYKSVQGFNDNVINPSLPSVYNFIGKIIDETVSMYQTAGAPLQTIHFGGDEVPEGVWEKSPAAKALLEKDSSLGSIDELWHYYFKKVNALLKAKNLYLSGWEEIGLKKQLVNGKKQMILDTRFANENFHTDVWNNLKGNEDLAYKLANAGYKVVLTNVTNLYLDLAYNKDYNEIGQYWGGYVDINKPFSFVPFDYYRNQTEDQSGNPLAENHYNSMDKLNENAKPNIVGLQAPLWAEVLNSKERFEYLFLPKILGLAERAWTTDPAWARETDKAKQAQLYQQDWSAFIHKIGQFELPRLDHYAGGFAYAIPTPGYSSNNGEVQATVLYPNLTIRYTTDGSEPSTKSRKYNSAIPLSAHIKFRAFNSEGRGGRTISVSR